MPTRISLPDHLLPVQALFNAAWDATFVDLIDSLSRGVGWTINDCGCEFPRTVRMTNQRFTVSAWLCGARLVLGQQQTDEKVERNQAISELLRVLDLKGTTVTIDAMGCQTAIADTIVKGGGAYLLAAKDSQGGRHEEVRRTLRKLMIQGHGHSCPIQIAQSHPNLLVGDFDEPELPD